MENLIKPENSVSFFFQGFYVLFYWGYECEVCWKSLKMYTNQNHCQELSILCVTEIEKKREKGRERDRDRDSHMNM